MQLDWELIMGEWFAKTDFGTYVVRREEDGAWSVDLFQYDSFCPNRLYFWLMPTNIKTAKNFNEVMKDFAQRDFESRMLAMKNKRWETCVWNEVLPYTYDGYWENSCRNTAWGSNNEKERPSKDYEFCPDCGKRVEYVRKK